VAVDLSAVSVAKNLMASDLVSYPNVWKMLNLNAIAMSEVLAMTNVSAMPDLLLLAALLV
jgi:hypothetical protein